MLKKLLVTSAILVMVAIPVFSAHAQSNEVVTINPAFQHEDVFVQAGQEIVFDSGWAACVPGLVIMFEATADINISDNGQLFNTESWIWSPLESTPIDPNNTLGYCIAGDKVNTWSSNWQSPELTFDPGEHEIYFYYYLNHQIADGADYNDDGKLDKFEGVIGENTFTIFVE